jgi:peroxiredoxin
VTSQLKSKNASVLGISADTVESHKRFVEKEHLNFPLLADTEKKMMTAYGVLAPNGFANRVTFIIGEDGRIREIDRAVNTQFQRDGSTLTTRHGTNLNLLLSDWKAHVGQPVPNFSLVDTDGKTVSLIVPGKKASVVLFLSTRSPASQAYRERIRALGSDPAYKDVAFLALYSNADETAVAIKNEAGEQKFGFPIARDTNNKLADHFGAATTTAAWVIDAKGIVVYAGAIDDNADAAQSRVHYLKDALDATLANKPPSNAETKPVGAAIKRVHAAKGR